MIENAKIDIVIVNWNSGHQLRDCIESVRRFHCGVVRRCIVVDNGSTDASADFLKSAGDIEVLSVGSNLGFAAGCNLGAARGDSPYILLLNPDACLLAGTLIPPLEYMQAAQNTQVGIVGVQLVDEHGAVQRTCAHFPRPWHFFASAFGLSVAIKSFDFKMVTWDHLETRFVDHVIGAFFLVRREIYSMLGGLDERFFVYLEDVDFSLRASGLGYRSAYLSHVSVYHKGGGVSEQVKAVRLFYSRRSRIQYAYKHFSLISAVGVSASMLLVEPLVRAIFLVIKRRWVELPDLWRGYVMLWGWAWAHRQGRA
ncbi:MAG: glycosyltransferase family 2 protein [Pseudomonadota bacterium]